MIRSMKRKKIVLPAFLLCFAIGMLLHGCSENDCSLGGRPAAVFNFNLLDPDKQGGLDSLTVIAMEPDSILLNKAKSVKAMSLPLSYTNSETVYILRYNFQQTDTIWLWHTNIPHFISMECGKDIFFHIDSIKYTTLTMDSIVIRNRDINDHEKENFQIYYSDY